MDLEFLSEREMEEWRFHGRKKGNSFREKRTQTVTQKVSKMGSILDDKSKTLLSPNYSMP